MASPATLWEEDGLLRNDVGSIKTGFDLTVDTTRYVASYDMMTGVADLEFTSTQWLDSSRQ